jgi:hypothetical protein
MRMTNTERVTLHRQRERLGQRPVPVVVSEREIDYLLAHDYELSRKDADSIGRAVSQFLNRRRQLLIRCEFGSLARAIVNAAYRFISRRGVS